MDALVQKVVYAPDRKSLVTATRALDRVLLHGEYLVPNWFIPIHRIAYWDKFGFPATIAAVLSATEWMLRFGWAKP